ncbi:Protein diaphanous-like 3 [Acipenser ruthenus]|uniref:Protein diaphanous-like 3 n=1 Tax=Acipenser ruthenus TaxID=7906 RepID=A0A444V5V2_ACIRT|nr:Protein diaphanous-like 3 [Acipenser ruthenus]
MNLNEDRKAPLREKDLNMKKEMVIRYISTASKTGGLKSSHQISPQEFISELKSGATDERLFSCLDSLRVSLTSNPVRFWFCKDRPSIITEVQKIDPVKSLNANSDSTHFS